MDTSHWQVIWAIVVSSIFVQAAHPASPIPSQIVHLTVLDVNGQPASHHTVYLRGWSAHWGYRNWGPFRDDALGGHRKADGWPYETNAEGKVSVLIGGPATSAEVTPPGPGTYAFVTEAGPNDAGGVSPRFYFGVPPNPKDDWAPEWGKPIKLPPGGLDLTLAIQTGVSVQGRIVDDQYLDRPLPGITVSVGTDLNIGTRSGIGNDIFDQSATTDRNGRFLIPHCFPNLLWVSVGPALWMKTRVNGAWVEADNLVKPDSPTGTIDLQMTARPNPAFTYFGIVTAGGRPSAGANIEASFTTEPIHPHSHYGMVEGRTDSAGNYTVTVGSPWANFVSASASDDPNRYVETKPANPFIAPGEYDLQLPPPTAKKHSPSPSP